MLQNGVENNVAVSAPSNGTGQNPQTSTSSNVQATLQPGNSVASASVGGQVYASPHAGQNVLAPVSAAPCHNNALFGIDQPTADQPVHTYFDDMGQMTFQIGCSCHFCRQWIAQERQVNNDFAHKLDGWEALIRPPPGPNLIAKLPMEVLDMIVAYVMGGKHKWYYSPPKTPLYAQQQVVPGGYHAKSIAKRDAGYLTDEGLLSLSQTCKLFRDVCQESGARNYMMIWAESDRQFASDFMRLSYCDRPSGLGSYPPPASLVSQVK